MVFLFDSGFFFPADEKLLLTWGSLATVDKGLCMSCKTAKGVESDEGKLLS